MKRNEPSEESDPDVFADGSKSYRVVNVCIPHFPRNIRFILRLQRHSLQDCSSTKSRQLKQVLQVYTMCISEEVLTRKAAINAVVGLAGSNGLPIVL